MLTTAIRLRCPSCQAVFSPGAKGCSHFAPLRFVEGQSKNDYPYPGSGYADWIFHVYHPMMRTALAVNLAQDPAVDSLAAYFEEVWALESKTSEPDSNLSILKDNIRGNVSFVQSCGLTLPFADRSFYVVILKDCSYRRLDEHAVREALRVLREQGILCLLVCQPVSPLLTVFGSVNGEPTERNSLSRYRSIVTAAGAVIEKECWVLPSYERPTWSSDLACKGSLRFVINGLGRQSIEMQTGRGRRFRIMRGFLVSRGGKLLLKATIRIWAKRVPYVVIFAQKGNSFPRLLDQVAECSNRDEEWVLRRGASTSNKLTLFHINRAGSGLRTFYISREANSADGVKKERLGARFNGYTKEFDVRMVDGRAVVEAPFYPGHIVNPSNASEASRAIEWLLSFQQNRVSAPIPREQFTSFIAKRIRPTLYDRIGKFLLETGGRTPRGSHEHGDFGGGNIISDGTRVSVVDWEFFESNGDQLFDFATFLLNWYFDAVEGKITASLRSFFHGSRVSDLVRRFCKQADVDAGMVWHYLPIAVARLEFRQGPNGRPEYKRALEETGAFAEMTSSGTA